MNNQTAAEVASQAYHHHDVTIITATIKKIEKPNKGRLPRIEFENFPDGHYYFYEGSLDEEKVVYGNEISLGRVAFSIGKEFSSKVFGEDMEDGYLLFHVRESQVEEQNLKEDGKLVFNRRYVATSDNVQKMEGTKACAPTKFMADGALISHEYQGYHYYPMVTFPDDQDEKSTCYLSFFKCKRYPGILDNAYPGYMFGFNDEPVLDPAIDAWIHTKIS